MKAMILAAGRGERLRPLTDTTPKPLVEVGGKPLIEHHIERLRAAGVTELVVNVSWLRDQIVEFLGDGSRWGVSVRISEEPPGALDTGGGVYNALALLGEEPFWLVNADVVTDFAFPPDRLHGDDLAHLVVVDGPTDDFSLSRGRIANTGPDPYTFAGISLLHPQLFADVRPGAFSLTPLLRRAADAGGVSGERHDGLWHDAGTPQRLAELRASD